MNNDLISREALREDLRRFFPTEVLEGIEPKTLFAQIMHDIDNAPTVEERPQVVIFSENMTAEEKQKLIAEFKAVMDNAKFTIEPERKQGEWIMEKNEWCKCSNCNKCNTAPYPL